MSIAERPIPDGQLVPAPDFLKEATPEEQRRWLVEQHKAKRRPPPLPEPVPPPAPEPAAVRPNGLQWTPQQEAESNRRDEDRWQQDMADLGHGDDNLFTAADLFTAPAAVWHTMPNGKKIGVHAVSGAEGVRITSGTRAYLRDPKKGLLTLPEEERGVYAELVPMCWQVVLCCRKTLDPNSPRVFEEKHVDALIRNHGWLEAVKAIVAKSQLVGGEERLLREVVRGFFGATATYLQTLRSELSTECPPSSDLLKSLEDFASFASRMKQVENLAAIDPETF